MESIQHPRSIPLRVKTGNMEYVDEEGKTILNWLSSNNDETHIYTASAMNRNKEIYGALVDVIDSETGEYKFSYVLDRVLHWPILLKDNYDLVSVTENYELVTWERNRLNE